jgi:hypothetical protein
MPEKPTLYAVFLILLIFLIVTGCTSTPGSAPVKNASGAAAPAQDTPSAAVTSAPSGTASSCIDGLALCSGFCRDLRTDAGNCGKCGITCPSDQGCSGGVCKPSAECGGNTCPVPTAAPIVKGTLLTTTLPEDRSRLCPKGYTVCGSNCVFLMNDTSNCGTCGTLCPVTKICEVGICTSPRK